MIDAKLLADIEATLDDSAPPRGCASSAVPPEEHYSFWSSLELAAAGTRSSHRGDSVDDGLSPAQALRDDAERLRRLGAASACPVIAVCGLLNSGKSSLVATFLSQPNRPRVLIGRGHEAGTHRFVFWLPESWKRHPEIWAAALQEIESAFGRPPETLDAPTDDAHRQYNNRARGAVTDGQESPTDRPAEPPRSSARPAVEGLATPLVATDPKLDELGVGLLDCPDVQSAAFSPDAQVDDALAGIADTRMQILLRGVRLCSAVIVVVQSNLIRDSIMPRLIRGLQHELPGVRSVLAINQVPTRYEVTDLIDEVRLHYAAVDLDSCYLAYDFRGPQAADRLPQGVRMGDDRFTTSSGVRLPTFFRVMRAGGEPETKPLDKDAEDRLLIAIGRRLDTAALALSGATASLERFAGGLRRGKTLLDGYVRGEHERTMRLNRVFHDAILNYAATPRRMLGSQPAVRSADGSTAGGVAAAADRRGAGQTPVPRLQMSREIIDQMRQSLERTAPWWARSFLKPLGWIAHAGRQAKAATIDKLPSLAAISGDLASSVQSIKDRLRRGESGSVLTATQFATLLRQADSAGDLPAGGGPIEHDPVVLAANNAIDRFQEESAARLDDDELDRLTARVWAQMTWRQKVRSSLAPAALLVAPILAVVMVPFDFGATHVLVFASIKELLVAGVAGAGLLLWKGDQLPEIAEQQVAWKQVGDLLAICSDAFGRPRPTVDQLAHLHPEPVLSMVAKSAVPVKPSRAETLPPHLVYQAGFEDRFKKLLDRLQSSRRG